MAIGDIDFVRIPIKVNPNDVPDAAAITAIGTIFNITDYDSINTIIVPGEGINSDKQVLVVTGRRLT